MTSFALSHIITAAGTGGMVCLDDDDLADRCLLLRRWGRRSEVQLFGTAKGTDARFFSLIDGDLEYDNLFIFDAVGWNFEPSELSAAFGLVQLEKLPENLTTRKRNFARLSEHFSQRPDVFVLPRTRRTWTRRGTCSRSSSGRGPGCAAPSSNGTWRITESIPAWSGRGT